LVAKVLFETSPEKIWDDLDESQKKRRESRVKKFLNTQAVEKMTIERLQMNNGKQELESWFNTLMNLE